MSVPKQQLGDSAVVAAASVGRRGLEDRREERAAFLFLIPWFVGLLGFLAIPLLYSLYLSLTSERLLQGGEFVGLQNYVYMFTQDTYFYHSMYITLKWLALTTPLYLVAGLLLSLLLNQKLFGMNVFRTILYIPAIISGVAVTILWMTMLNPELGTVNFLLRGVGIDNPPAWFASPTWAMPGLALMGLWGVGGTAVIYLAGLQNIPPHLYEAASIDGAGPIAKFRYVTLPMLSPTIFFLLMNMIIDGILVFGPAFLAASTAGGSGSGGPDDSLLFYMLYLYQRAFGQSLLGYAAALAWILTIVGVLLVWILFRLEKRFVFYEV